jgi:hypothetical protein
MREIGGTMRSVGAFVLAGKFVAREEGRYVAAVVVAFAAAIYYHSPSPSPGSPQNFRRGALVGSVPGRRAINLTVEWDEGLTFSSSPVVVGIGIL